MGDFSSKLGIASFPKISAMEEIRLGSLNYSIRKTLNFPKAMRLIMPTRSISESDFRITQASISLELTLWVALYSHKVR